MIRPPAGIQFNGVLAVGASGIIVGGLDTDPPGDPQTITRIMKLDINRLDDLQNGLP